jgi:hypothetical protein
MAGPRTKEWKDFDMQKTYAVSLAGLPRRIYNSYSPREAVESYKRDLMLSSAKPIFEFTIHEVKNG